MRNIFLRLLCLILFTSLFSCTHQAHLFQVDEAKTGVNYKKTRGTICNQNYPFTHFRLHEVDSTTQWTPSEFDFWLDGCSYYWQIKLNLDQEELSDLWINGIA